MNKNKIGKLLKEYRKKANLTQPQLAGASGVATSIVNDVENGIRLIYESVQTIQNGETFSYFDA